jgi:hypothetical protein
MSSHTSDPDAAASTAPPAERPAGPGRLARTASALARLLPLTFGRALRSGAWLARTALHLIPTVRKIDADKTVQLERDQYTAMLAMFTVAAKHDIAAKALSESCPSHELAEVLRALDPPGPALLPPPTDTPPSGA